MCQGDRGTIWEGDSLFARSCSNRPKEAWLSTHWFPSCYFLSAPPTALGHALAYGSTAGDSLYGYLDDQIAHKIRVHIHQEPALRQYVPLLTDMFVRRRPGTPNLKEVIHTKSFPCLVFFRTPQIPCYLICKKMKPSMPSRNCLERIEPYGWA